MKIISSLWLRPGSGKLSIAKFKKLSRLVAMGGFLWLTGVGHNAGATNYFNWDAESNSTSIGPVLGYRMGTTQDCSVAHTGSCSMKLRVVGNDNNNQGMGIDLNQNNYPFSVVGNKSLYYRWWMNIQPGFSWGIGGTGHHLTKASRVLGVAEIRVYTGFLEDKQFSISECGLDPSQPGGICDPNVGGDHAAVINYDMTKKNDGIWHEYIVRVKPNSTPISYDAEFQVWVDGRSIGQVNNWHLHSFGSNGMIEAWGGWMVQPYFQLGSTASDGGTIYLDDFSTDDVWNSLIPGSPFGGLPAPGNLQVR